MQIKSVISVHENFILTIQVTQKSSKFCFLGNKRNAVIML